MSHTKNNQPDNTTDNPQMKAEPTHSHKDVQKSDAGFLDTLRSSSPECCSVAEDASFGPVAS